jgi:hypothetical protein
MSHVAFGCWAVVALLALAAAYNHRWHHARDSHPATRLSRGPSDTGGKDACSPASAGVGRGATR